MLQSRRYSSSSSTGTTSYPYRQSLLELRDGQEFMSMLPPMNTEEDLLQEDMLDSQRSYHQGDLPEILTPKRHRGFIQTILALVSRLRRRLGKR
ncbi:hypothetical protein BD414DRAFT_323435 [Trametes punicea]|nr:hypothetical protein BD414DRAFT_323435 [Trametes punicea]